MAEKENNVKQKKKYSILNILLNITILSLIGVLAWMLTDPSSGELIKYTGKLIVPENDVDVKLYVLKNNQYIEQSQDENEPLIETKLLQPGADQKYRFDITNKKQVVSLSKIVFTGITGDVDLLKDVVIINVNNPTILQFKIGDKLKYDEEHKYYYFDFIDELRIQANETISIYWNIEIDKKAGNEIQDTNLKIDKIMFINP